ncbi:hypothetical protein Patl1_36631 [Pistacia atlantica]|nr:hypothetical protein Patl1_36631 [Pistacia atlantica]
MCQCACMHGNLPCDSIRFLNNQAFKADNVLFLLCALCEILFGISDSLLMQVHKRNCTIKTVQNDVKMNYGKYAPFQFLAYWSEVWHFYEGRFGNLSAMPYSNYKLITASNMRT